MKWNCVGGGMELCWWWDGIVLVVGWNCVVGGMNLCWWWDKIVLVVGGKHLEIWITLIYIQKRWQETVRQ